MDYAHVDIILLTHHVRLDVSAPGLMCAYLLVWVFIIITKRRIYEHIHKTTSLKCVYVLYIN